MTHPVPELPARLAVDGSAAARSWRVWLPAFLVALALYVLTANRGADWQDAGVHQVRIMTGEILNARGLALTHPLHYHLGRLALHLPVAPALAITLISCLAGAIAVANVAALVHMLTGDRHAGWLAAGAIGLAHMFWQHASHTETCTPMAALLTLEWLCLAKYAQQQQQRWLILLVLANGLGIANHLLALLAAPVVWTVLLIEWRRRRLSTALFLAGGAVWVAGTLPFAGLVVREGLASHDWAQTINSALFGRYRGAVLNTRVSFGLMGISLLMVLYNFPSLALPAAAWGVRHRERVPTLVRRVLLVELAIYALFVLRYGIRDQYTYLFVVYLPIAVWVGIGAACWGGSRSGRHLRMALAVTLATTPLVYAVASRVASARGTLDKLLPNKPYRDNSIAFLEPWGTRSRYADRLNAAVARVVGEDGLVLVEDSMVLPGLQYAGLTGQLGNHVTLAAVSTRGASERLAELGREINQTHARGAPIVFVPLDRDEVPAWPEHARWERYEEIYRLVDLGSAPKKAIGDR